MAKSSSKSVNSPTLALSDWHLKIQHLEKQYQWFLKQIKKKRTELNNFVEQMQTLAREMYAKGTPKMQEMLTLDQEIHKLFDYIFSNRKLSKTNRAKVEDIYENLQELGLISPADSWEEDLDEDLDELFENMKNEAQKQRQAQEESQENFFNFNQEEIEEKKGRTQDSETRQIRKTFLRLASIFHPDKVKDEESHLSHTEIMQEVNRAYQEGDLAKLLEIENKYQTGAKIDINNENHLARQAQLLEERNDLLSEQYEELKRELRLVRNTPEGEMVSDYRRAKRQKIDMIAENLKELDQRIDLIKGIRDFVKSFKDKKISVKKFLQGPQCLRKTEEEMMEEILEQLIREEFIEFF